MRNDIQDTVFPGNALGMAQDKLDVLVHIMRKMRMIADQIETLGRITKHRVISEPPFIGDFRARELNDLQTLQINLAQYAKCGDVIASPATATAGRSLFVSDIHDYIADLLSDRTRFSHLKKAPQLVSSTAIPRLMRRDIQIHLIIELLVHTLTAYEHEGKRLIRLSLEGDTKESADNTEVKISCGGALNINKLTVESFTEVSAEVLSGNWRRWKLLGTRMVACLIGRRQVGGRIAATSATETSFDFEALIPMSVLHLDEVEIAPKSGNSLFAGLRTQ